MRLGMTLPVMEPDLWAVPDTLERWSRAVDEGPFASLCFGERVAFDNPETLTLLGAAAAWTSRVRLVTTVLVPQLHRPAPLAKALATADRLCGGRLTVGFGVGGREEDYRAAEADGPQTMAEMARRVDQLKRIWAGEKLTERRSRSVRRRSRSAARRCWSGRWGRAPCAPPRPGRTGWPASPSTSTSP